MPPNEDRLWELAASHARLATVTEQIERDVDDHETRLAELEAQPSKVAAKRTAAVLQILGPIGASIATWLLGHLHLLPR